jgi:hypothetical protein
VKERATYAVETGVKNESVQNYSVQYKGYNLIGVTTVERGDGTYDSTSLFLYIRQLLQYSQNCTLYTNKIRGATVWPLKKLGETGLHSLYKLRRALHHFQRFTNSFTLSII